MLNGLGQSYTGCVRHDHEDAEMQEPHDLAVLEYNVNIEVQPRILFSHLGVPYPNPQSIIANVSTAQMQEWLEGKNLDQSRRTLRVAMGTTKLDLVAIGQRIAGRTLAGPYAGLARAESSNMHISEQEAQASVQAMNEFRPWLPENDEGGAVFTEADYYAGERHRLKEEQGDVEAVSFVVFSREAYDWLPVAKTTMRANLANWDCASLGEWHRKYQLHLQDALYTEKLQVQ